MQPDFPDFRSNIDWLIANRQRPVFNTGGLFTQTSNNTTTNTNLAAILETEYLRRLAGLVTPSGGDGNSFVGNPNSTVSAPWGSPTNADDVARWSQAQGAVSSPSGRQAASMFGGLLFGPVGSILGKYALEPAFNYFGERSMDNFLAAQDQQAANIAAAQGLGGVGTYSDTYGNMGTFSNQAMIDAYDREVFGVTGSELSSTVDSGGYDYSGVNDAFGASHSDYGDTGYDR